MLTSITPLGERGRNQRWGVTVTAYVLASGLGGAAIGALLGALGQIALGGDARTVALGALGVVAVAGLVLDARVGSIPTIHRQVNEDWLARYRGWVYGAGFGVQLGVGVATIVTTASLYVVLAAALLSRNPSGGLLIGLTFGLARALPIVLTRRVDNPRTLRDVMRRVHAGARNARVAVMVGQAVIVAVTASLVLASVRA